MTAVGGSWASEESRHINLLVMDAVTRVRHCEPLLWGRDDFGEDRLDRSLAAGAPPWLLMICPVLPVVKGCREPVELLGLRDAALSKRSSSIQITKANVKSRYRLPPDEHLTEPKSTVMSQIWTSVCGYAMAQQVSLCFNTSQANNCKSVKFLLATQS